MALNEIPVSADNAPNAYKQFPYTLAAGASVDVFYDHRFFRVLSLSGGSLNIRFENSGEASDFVGAGVAVEHLAPRRRVTLKNTHATDSMTLTIGLSMGRIYDDRLVASGTLTTQETKGTTFASVADVALTDSTATQIAAASSTRRELHISNLLANGVSIRIGDSAVSATEGVELLQGSTYILSTTAAVFGYVVGTGKTVGVLSVSD